jgi:hypothetical protein
MCDLVSPLAGIEPPRVTRSSLSIPLHNHSS